MEKIIELGELLSWYGPLLTDRQRSIADQYANENCSLSEIAEREDISRQGVRDALVRAEEQLHGYEKHLKLFERYVSGKRILLQLRVCIETSALSDKEKKRLLQGLSDLETIWEQ